MSLFTLGMVSPAVALTDEEKAALAAAAILGVAAIAHGADHHHDGAHKSDAEYEAKYERGYRDGLHNEPYDSAHSSEAYGLGYDAGHKERSNNLAYKHNSHGSSVPVLAMRGCVGEASAKWSRNPRDIHVTKTKKLASDDFMVEVSAGHKHGHCEMSAKGEVYMFEKGKM